MSLVFFDFDQTLTCIDTTLPFASFLACTLKKKKNYYLLLGIYLLAKFKLISNHVLKQWFAKLLLYNQPVGRINFLATKFFKSYLALVENQEVVDLLRWYAANGNEVCIVSANFNFFLNPLKDKWPVTDILATCADINDDIFTGKLLGKACHGHEKVMSAVSFFGEKKVKDAIAYGDSNADLCFLEYTRKGNWVHAIKAESRASIFYKKMLLYFFGLKYLSVKNMFKCKTEIFPINT